MQTTEVVVATSIKTTREGLTLIIAGRPIFIPWAKCSPKLAAATDAERLKAELSPGGYGIHWPLLDEDLSVGGLLRERKRD